MDSGSRLLLQSLASPERVERLSVPEWESLVRAGRASKLLGVLHARLEAAGSVDAVPAPALRHLVSERAVAAYQRQIALHALRQVRRTLAPLGVPVILLKGCAYAARNAPWADGRPSADLDLMVRPRDLRTAEQHLHAAGWRGIVLDEYDERYYRDWSHEVPPMHHPERRIELDLHHTIAPVTGRVRPDVERLVERSIALDEAPLRVLAPADQFLHTCIHLVQDSDFWRQLRDLVDLDGMIRAQGGDAGFWEALFAHAAHHGLKRPLHYALRYCDRFLQTPMPAEVLARNEFARPPRAVRALMDAIVPRSLLPGNPDRLPTFSERQARRALKLRYMWMRFPPGLFVRHVSTKAWRRVWEGR